MPLPTGLFPILLGARWDALPLGVRALHGSQHRVNARGRVVVSGDSRWPARALRGLLGLPPPCADAAIDVRIIRNEVHEIWARRFGDARMQSVLTRSRRHPDAFEEHLGPARFAFALAASGAGLRWVLREARVLAVRLPLRWFGGLIAGCAERDGRYRFEIAVQLPGIGLLVAYAGWLEIVDVE